MEITRSIKKETINSVLTEYRKENENEIFYLMKMITDVKENLKIGEKMIEARYNYSCEAYLKKLFENIKISNAHKFLELDVDEYRKSIIDGMETRLLEKRYNKDNLIFEEYKRCKFFIQPKIENKLIKLKNQIQNFKKEENEIINKCFVLEFEEVEIKNCLKSEFSQLKKNLMIDIKDYYDELKIFREKIYL